MRIGSNEVLDIQQDRGHIRHHILRSKSRFVCEYVCFVSWVCGKVFKRAISYISVNSLYHFQISCGRIQEAIFKKKFASDKILGENWIRHVTYCHRQRFHSEVFVHLGGGLFLYYESSGKKKKQHCKFAGGYPVRNKGPLGPFFNNIEGSSSNTSI